MALLDPIFAEALKPFIHRPAPAPTGYFQSATCLRDEISGLEGDIENWQTTMKYNAVEIPRMQLESLRYELAVAKANLKIHELRAKLAAKTGGAQ